jgi:hypothetical protein
MGRGASRQDEESGPLRTCAATRAARPVEELIRFVASSDGVVTPDLRARLPGRGVWVTAARAAVEQAVKRKAFARSLKRSVEAPATLAADVEALLERDALQALSLATKAGLLTTGFAKVEAAIAAGAPAALIEARDGAEDGRRKLAAALRRAGRESTPVVDLFDSGALAMASGRPHVIHAALAAGGAAENFLARCRRLGFYRADARQTPAAERGGDDETSGGASPDVIDDRDGRSPGTENG